MSREIDVVVPLGALLSVAGKIYMYLCTKIYMYFFLRVGIISLII